MSETHRTRTNLQLEEFAYQWIQQQSREYGDLFPAVVECYAPEKGTKVPESFDSPNAGYYLNGVRFDYGSPFNADLGVSVDSTEWPDDETESRWNAHVSAFASIMAETPEVIYFGREHGGINLLPADDAPEVLR